MSSDTLKVSYKNVGKLLTGKEVKTMLKMEASDIRKRCGEGYSIDEKKMGSRTIASVYTATYDAMKDNYENNTLLKAL